MANSKHKIRIPDYNRALGKREGGQKMAVRFYKGDLIEDAKVDIVCHQTNCQGVMGAGIAKQIRDTWPRVFGQ